jgi:signal peptidase II
MSDPTEPKPPAAIEGLVASPAEPAEPVGVAASPVVSPSPVEPGPTPVIAAPLSHPPQSVDHPDRPTFVFFGVVAAISLIADVLSKAWAEIVLSSRPFDDPSIVLIKKHLTFSIAYNKGGAWGLLQDAPEGVRRPFFFAVSVLAVLFIVSLYSKLGKSQRALTWGLPLVLGGALGNLSDRVTRSSVIDFIDYRADWVLSMNQLVAKAVPRWGLTDHWPTFNVADIAICIGVGLMAVDMFTSRRGPERASLGPVVGA